MCKYISTNFYEVFFHIWILFQVEHYTIKKDIMKYYLLPNSTVFKL